MARTLLFASDDVPGPARIGGKPKSFDVQVQDIASAAHARGIILVSSEQIVGTLEAAELCRTIRSAREQTRGQDGKFDHVARLANGIHARLGVRGAVQVSRSAWNLLVGYAKPRTAESACTAPKRSRR